MAEQPYSLSGAVDIATQHELQAELLALINTTNNDVVVDCAALEFIDSSGIAVLLHIQRLLEMQERGFRLSNLHGMPRRSIDLLGLAEAFGVAELNTA